MTYFCITSCLTPSVKKNETSHFVWTSRQQKNFGTRCILTKFILIGVMQPFVVSLTTGKHFNWCNSENISKNILVSVNYIKNYIDFA